MKVYRLFSPVSESYGRVYLNKGAAKGAAKRTRHYNGKREDLEIHEFELLQKHLNRFDVEGKEIK